MCINYKHVLISFFLAFSLAKADYLEFDQNNVATEECVAKLKEVNINPSQIIPGIGANHILNVALTMCECGCFQRDECFYKNGNQSKFSENLSLEQAINFLNKRYIECCLCWSKEVKKPVSDYAKIDWKFDMDSYGYTECLGSKDCATIAWTALVWNAISREVFTRARSCAS